MKGQIRYLYEYQNGTRTQNVGFIKAEENDGNAVIQIYGKGFPAMGNQSLEILLFYRIEEQCIGISMGKIPNFRSGTGYRLSYNTDDVGGQECFSKIEGILLKGERCYAVLKNDRAVSFENMIMQEDWKRLNDTGDDKDSGKENPEEEEKVKPQEEKLVVHKITRQDLVKLPRQEWKLANNNFLLHGYRNYHYLISFYKDEESWLGIPGIYHPKEQKVASAFGFGQFMKLDNEEEDSFGYWCRRVETVIEATAP